MMDAILEAIEESALMMSQAEPGSDERIRGVTLLGVITHLRNYREALEQIAEFPVYTDPSNGIAGTFMSGDAVVIAQKALNDGSP